MLASDFEVDISHLVKSIPLQLLVRELERPPRPGADFVSILIYVLISEKCSPPWLPPPQGPGFPQFRAIKKFSL